MVRYADRAHDMTPTDRRKRIDSLSADLDPVTAGCDTLKLALLLSAETNLRDLDRAGSLIDTFVDGTDETAPLHDFARYQRTLLAERVRWINAVQLERRSRREVEHKIEELKAIELRMNAREQNPKLPLRESAEPAQAAP